MIDSALATGGRLRAMPNQMIWAAPWLIRGSRSTARPHGRAERPAGTGSSVIARSSCRHGTAIPIIHTVSAFGRHLQQDALETGYRSPSRPLR